MAYTLQVYCNKSVLEFFGLKHDYNNRVYNRAESFRLFKSRGGPLKKGEKELPKGKPNCLRGYGFTVTGVSESLERHEILQLIRSFGGFV